MNRSGWLLPTTVLLVISSTACTDLIDCESGSGDVTFEVRDFEGFTSIELDGSADLVLTQADSFSVRVEAQENLLDNVQTRLDGERLVIGNDECWSTSKGVRVHVSLPSLRSLELDGAGDASATNRFTGESVTLRIDGSGDLDLDVTADVVSLEIDGSGDMNLNIVAETLQSRSDGSGSIDVAGAVPLHTLEIDGSGDIEAFALLTDTTDARLSGSGSAEVSVAKHLTARLTGSGDLIYRGNPTVDLDDSGSGEIRRD